MNEIPRANCCYEGIVEAHSAERVGILVPSSLSHHLLMKWVAISGVCLWVRYYLQKLSALAGAEWRGAKPSALIMGNVVHSFHGLSAVDILVECPRLLLHSFLFWGR